MSQRIDKTSRIKTSERLEARLDVLLAEGLPGLPANPAAIGRTLDALAAERALARGDLPVDTTCEATTVEATTVDALSDPELDQLLGLLDGEAMPSSTKAARAGILQALRAEEDAGLLRPFESGDPLWDLLGDGLPARSSTPAARQAVLATIRGADRKARRSRSAATGGTAPVEPLRIGPRPAAGPFGLFLRIAAALLVMATIAVLLNRTPDDSRVAIEPDPGSTVDHPREPAPQTMRIPEDPNAPDLSEPLDPLPDPDQKDHDPLEWILRNPVPKKSKPESSDRVRGREPAIARTPENPLDRPGDRKSANPVDGGSTTEPAVSEEMQLAQRYDLTKSELEVVKNLELLKRLEEAEVYAVVMDLDLLGAVESEDFE